MDGRIVVLVSGSGSNMAALADACNRGEVPARVVGVVADRQCPALQLANGRGIPWSLCDFAAFGSREEWSARLRDIVGAHAPDVVVSAGLMRILSLVFVDAFAGRLLNLHPSLLPAFPGAHAVRDALRHGVKVTGTTIHFIDGSVDGGPILLQEAVPVAPDDDEVGLHSRIKQIEHRLLPHACALLLKGQVRVEGRRVLVGADPVHTQ
jgi:phosphoribosylglycinamide formyltransferase-1